MIGHVCELAFQYAHVNGIQGFSEETRWQGKNDWGFCHDTHK